MKALGAVMRALSAVMSALGALMSALSAFMTVFDAVICGVTFRLSVASLKLTVTVLLAVTGMANCTPCATSAG